MCWRRNLQPVAPCQIDVMYLRRQRRSFRRFNLELEILPYGFRGDTPGICQSCRSGRSARRTLTGRFTAQTACRVERKIAGYRVLHLLDSARALLHFPRVNSFLKLKRSVYSDLLVRSFQNIKVHEVFVFRDGVGSIGNLIRKITFEFACILIRRKRPDHHIIVLRKSNQWTA